MTEALCLSVVCAVPLMLIVGGTLFLSRRMFALNEDEEWDEFEDAPELEPRY